MVLVLYSQVSQHSSLPISLVLTIFCNTDPAKSKSYFYLIQFAIQAAGIIIINKGLQFLINELAVLRLHCTREVFLNRIENVLQRSSSISDLQSQ